MNSSLPIHLRSHTSPETFDHQTFIANICKFWKPNVYLEYGLSNCLTTSAVAPFCKKLIGVDVNHHSNMNTIPNLEFYKMTTSDFKPILDSLNIKIDVAFIDACHNSKVVVQDFHDIFPHLSENGMIFLHDTYPVDSIYLKPSYCDDCYKTPNVIKYFYGSQIEILTLPIQPGLTCVRKLPLIPLPFHDMNIDFEIYKPK